MEIWGWWAVKKTLSATPRTQPHQPHKILDSEETCCAISKAPFPDASDAKTDPAREEPSFHQVLTNSTNNALSWLLFVKPGYGYCTRLNAQVMTDGLVKPKRRSHALVDAEPCVLD